MNHQSAIDHIIEVMRKGLPETLRYHDLDHTLDVMSSAKKIGLAEGVGEESMNTLLTAAAYHDCGFLKTYKDHEEMSCKVVEDVLPGFGFDQNTINVIQDMIISTRIPQSTETLLGRILCDADLDYLGGNEYDRISHRLLDELTLNGVDVSHSQWLNIQIKFLEEHEFWTDFAIKMHTEQKARTLERLKKELSEFTS